MNCFLREENFVNGINYTRECIPLPLFASHRGSVGYTLPLAKFADSRIDSGIVDTSL